MASFATMQRWSVCALIAVACGGTSSRPAARTHKARLDEAVDRLVAAARQHDVAEVASMLGPSLASGGLWFDDVTCREQVSIAGSVSPAGVELLARCLATLPLERSERTSVTPDVAVLSYEPGIEIEVMFDVTAAEPKVRWIGYAGRRGAEDGLPTITPDVLEELRTGDRRAVTKDATSVTSLKICLDVTGAVESVHARATTSSEDLAAAVATAKQWRFRPFVLGGQPARVCAVVDLADPTGDAVEPSALSITVPDRYADAIIVPIVAMEEHRIAGTKNVTPDDRDKTAIKASRRGRVASGFELCVERTGEVGWILMLDSSGYPRYDARIATELAAWRFTPFRVNGSPMPVCTQLTFIYVQR